jgi:ribosomal-protein-alanine N-acetyltransferase
VRYRLFEADDFAALYAIEEICFQPPERFSRVYMRHLVSQKNAATWVAEDDLGVCGFAILARARGESRMEAYVETLEVLPQRRGRGVGGEMLRCVERSAAAAGANEIWLHVNAGNASAIRLYETHGFGCEGREENYYGHGEDALIYAKALGH